MSVSTERNTRRTQLAAFCMFAIVIAALFGLVLLTVGSYRSVTEEKMATDRDRAALSFVSSALHASDTEGAVTSGMGPEGQMLVLADATSASGATVYETRIYLYDGWLVEEYSAHDDALEPSQATRIAKTDTFSFTISADGLVSVTTDAGTRTVALQSYPGGEVS